MKKLLLILLTILSINNIGFSQGGLNLTYPENKRVYVGQPIDDMKKTAEILQNKYNKNFTDYYDFYNGAIKNLDTDKKSLYYESQIYAINNFVDFMKSYVNNGNWEDATYDLIKAKSQYYYDLQNYSTKEEANKKLVTKADAYVGIGKISFWSNWKNSGSLELYVDGIYVGKFTSYFKSGEPVCGQEGVLS